MPTDSFTTAGTYTWICPDGVTSVTTLEVAGADGSGAAPGAATGYAGGGGGGGSYAKWSTVTVVPGTGYTVTVGAGGPQRHAATGTAGGLSSIVIAGTSYQAAGGGAGLSGTLSTGGAAGAGGAATTTPAPTAAFAGGNGAQGTPGTGPAGGGGGKATTSGAGANASGGTAGTGGGNGGTSSSPNGVAGTAGAGGGGYNNGTTPFSGAGTDGYVKLTYTLPSGGLTFRQASSSVGVGTGSVAPSLPSASLAGSLLVASLASQGGLFTGPSGWQSAAGISSGGSSGTPVAVNVGAHYPRQTLGYPDSGQGKSLADYTWATGYLGNLGCTKLFYNGQLPSTFTGAMGSDLPAGVIPVICYKTQSTNVTSYVSTVDRPIVLVWYQEPEGNFSSGSAFVSAFKAQSRLIRSVGNSNVQVAMCSAGYPYRNAGSSDVLSGNYLRGLGPYVDLFLKDIYQDSAVSSWWTPHGLADQPMFQNWLALVTGNASLATSTTTANAIQAAGGNITGTPQPLGISEYGVGQTAGNSARNTRIALDASYLSGAFTSQTPFDLQYWMFWWRDNGMTSSTDLVHEEQFLDAATQNLWASYCAGAAAGAPGHAAVWYRLAAPSGITSATFTTTSGQEALGVMAEFTSDAGTIQALDTKGTAASGAAKSLAVTATPAAAAADVAVAAFLTAYPSGGTAASWGTPSGMTADGSRTGDVVNLWAGHQAQLPAGAYSATQTYSDTTMAGWAGVTATFSQVSGTSTLAVVTSSLPDGTEGATYSATLEASGGTAPYTWAVQ